MLKKLKQATLHSLKSTGVSTIVRDSRWRRQHLLILAYHGISLSDEHLWNSSQFMPADVFRTRLEQLQKSNCAVLPLGEAVQRLYAEDLPDRAVVLTFDDGTSDFSRKAFPLLNEFGFPATLYLTTFYTHYNRPVFDLMCSYLLWKGRDASLDLNVLTQKNLTLPLSKSEAQDLALHEIKAFAREQKLSAEEKDELLGSLATQLHVDYSELVAQRIMHNLTVHEVKQLAAGGADIQLHTHRHRTPMNRELFLREIEDNRASIQAMTGRKSSHFCYPSGVHNPAFLPWLKEAEIVSATTCDTGFASADSNSLLLSRVLDNPQLSAIEFESWLTGISAALPRRRKRRKAA
ncbi:MAG TPA: polysaccharide deacetylase family protein [Terriglobales bacterium]|nr:polysaccharide deacetylase family protein [Terriglobales bacterium]